MTAVLMTKESLTPPYGNIMKRELITRLNEFSVDAQTGVKQAVQLAFDRSLTTPIKEVGYDPQLQEAYTKVKQQNLKLKQELEEIRAGLGALERQKRDESSQRVALDNTDLAQDDSRLKQAYGTLTRAKEELELLRSQVETSKHHKIVQLEDEVAFLRKQLAAHKQENQTIKGTRDLMTNALELDAASQSKKEALQSELSRERSRLMELKAQYKQLQRDAKPSQDNYAELDLRIRNLIKTSEGSAPLPAEVRLAEATKRAQIMHKAVKTQNSTADRAIAEAEERLRSVIMETNKASAVLNERAQQLKLKNLKVKELQAKVQQLQPRIDVTAEVTVTAYIRSLNAGRP
jgi:DNA repair exonuclease SbcCD ATPase subunit